MKVGIISYGIGNIGSIVGSINNLGINYQIIEEEKQFDNN